MRSCVHWQTLIRFLNRLITIHVAHPSRRVWRALWFLLALWPALHVADLVTTAILIARGYREGNPIAAFLLAHGGLVALVAVTALGLGGGIVLALVGVRWRPRMTLAILAVFSVWAVAAVVNNTVLLLLVLRR